MIDQQRKLLEPDATVRQILAEGGDWIDVRGVRKHVMAYLKDFLFDPGLVDTKVGILSGGERSRLLLAREFARTANLLVLDEPFAGLDPAIRANVVESLLSQAGDGDFSAIIATHDIDEIDRVVDRVGILDRGRLVLDEAVDSLLGRFRCVVARTNIASQASHLEWLGVECRPPALSFVETRFDAASLGERVRAVFPDAEHIDAAPMSLKEIFIAIAQSPSTNR